MFLFGPIMSKTSKKAPILIGTPIRMIASFAMIFFSYEGGPFVVILILSFVIGFAMAGVSISIYAILNDLVEVDELITSINRPGICSGMATFIRKIAAGISSAVIGLLLTMVGYNESLATEGLRQSASTQRGIAYIYVFAQLILLLITLILAIKFPVTKKEFDIVCKEIKRRKGEEESIITDEEKSVCEKVTGYKFEKLWNVENALGKNTDKELGGSL